MAVPRTSRLTTRSRRKEPRREQPPHTARNGDTPPTAHEFAGQVRLGKRTKRLVKRLGPGDVAIIDHAAIDKKVLTQATLCRCHRGF